MSNDLTPYNHLSQQPIHKIIGVNDKPARNEEIPITKIIQKHIVTPKPT